MGRPKPGLAARGPLLARGALARIVRLGGALDEHFLGFCLGLVVNAHPCGSEWRSIAWSSVVKKWRSGGCETQQWHDSQAWHQGLRVDSCSDSLKYGVCDRRLRFRFRSFYFSRAPKTDESLGIRSCANLKCPQTPEKKTGPNLTQIGLSELPSDWPEHPEVTPRRERGRACTHTPRRYPRIDKRELIIAPL